MLNASAWRISMKKIKPFSAFYYVKENKRKSILCIFMIFLTTLMFLAGNFIYSVIYMFEKEIEYSEKIVEVTVQGTDEEYKDYMDFRQKVQDDEKLKYVESTAYGFSCMRYSSVLNLEMGSSPYIFNSKDDMERVFNRLGIKGDLSDCKHNSMVISKDFANNKGIKLGDKVDSKFDSDLDREYTIDAIIDDKSFCTFIIFEDNESLGRLYIYSDSMEGEELYNYVINLAGDKNVHIFESKKNLLWSQVKVFYVLFYTIDILIAVVLAVTVNSVVTGQYIRRTFEFGIYRALGKSKKEVRRKVASEVIVMNILACVVGFLSVLIFTYMINELYYRKKGLYLLYFSWMGLIGFIICDALIVIPLILSKGGRMSKANITEF